MPRRAGFWSTAYSAQPGCGDSDTAVVAGAPVRFLVAGIGDGLSTYFEAEASSRTRKRTMAGGAPTQATLAIARLCYETLLEHGLAARLAVERGAITPALEKVVEADTLLSGLGFESGGLGAAHSVHNGLTALEGTHDHWHGEKVAFGVISMLMLEGRPAEEVVDFCLEVGLPVALEDIGLEGVGREELERVAEAACMEGETIHNMPYEVIQGWSSTPCSPPTPSEASAAPCSKEKRACPPWRPSRRTARSHPKAHGESRIRRDRKPVRRGRAGTSGASPVRLYPRASGGSRPRYPFVPSVGCASPWPSNEAPHVRIIRRNPLPHSGGISQRSPLGSHARRL
jgi:Iron-containing alcohol dehydrogenase